MKKKNRFQEKISFRWDKKYGFLSIGLFVIAIVLGYVAIQQYYNNQQFSVTHVEPAALQQLVEKNQLTENADSSFTMELTDYEWSQLLTQQLASQDFGTYQLNNIIYKEHAIHMELLDDEKKVKSFKMDVDFVETEDQLLMNLSNFQMGILNSKLFSYLSKAKQALPEKFVLDMRMENEFIVVSRVEKLESGIELVLDYDRPQLAKHMEQYGQGINKAKWSLQKDKGTVSESLIDVFTASPNETQQDELIDYVRTGEEAIINLALIFNETTTRQFLQEFKELYAKRINIERVVTRSISDLEQSVYVYHHQFSRALMRYLYEHPTYSLNGQNLIANGKTITAATIIQSQGLNEQYTTTIENATDYIYAHYQVGDMEMKKVVLKKEGAMN